MHLATAIPRDLKDWSADARVRREGTQNLLRAADQSHVRRYVQQSMVRIYGEQGKRVVDETVNVHPLEQDQATADMESYVRASSLDWCIARGGFFYGPGTGREEGWRQSIRTDGFRLPGDGSTFLSLIHIADMARGIVLCAEAAPAGSIYNIVDDEPVSYSALYEYLAAQENRPKPESGGPLRVSSLACSNAKVKKELQWQPAYPTFRSGLAM
jgi:nucleoside-diphosphate-sugar epimerase